jgi:hypothetical protein
MIKFLLGYAEYLKISILLVCNLIIQTEFIEQH